MSLTFCNARTQTYWFGASVIGSWRLHMMEKRWFVDTGFSMFCWSVGRRKICTHPPLQKELQDVGPGFFLTPRWRRGIGRTFCWSPPSCFGSYRAQLIGFVPSLFQVYPIQGSSTSDWHCYPPCSRLCRSEQFHVELFQVCLLILVYGSQAQLAYSMMMIGLTNVV